MLRRTSMRLRSLTAVGVLGCLLVSACASPESRSGGGQAAEGDKLPSRVTLVIPYGEGGGTDTWARFMAPYLSEAIEGTTFVPENRPGGESITGSNQFVVRGGTDGKEILVTSGTTYFQFLLGRKEVKFDFTKMRPLLLNGTGGVIYVSKDSGITSVEDLKNPPKPLKYGGISATGLDLSAILAFELLGVDVQATFGFEGRGPARLALERGETNIDYQTTSAYQTEVEPMVEKGQAVPLMSFGMLDEQGRVVRDPNLPDLPTVVEVYRQLHGSEPTGEAYEAYRTFLAAGFPYQKGIWANEGTPDSIVQQFYDAAEKLRDDPEFNTAGEPVLGGYPVYPGSEVADAIQDAFSISDSARQYVLDLLRTKYGARIETGD